MNLKFLILSGLSLYYEYVKYMKGACVKISMCLIAMEVMYEENGGNENTV